MVQIDQKTCEKTNLIWNSKKTRVSVIIIITIESNRMLRHILGGAVICISLQQFIAPDLRLLLCLQA